jgi:hypothetical protein
VPTRSYFRTITATVRLTCSPRRLVHPLVQAAGSLLCLVLVCLLLPVAVAMANDQTTEELAKESENPITRRIAIPAESNTSFVVRPGDGVQETLKLKPVIPFALDDGWNLITRTIAPITFQPRKGAQQPAAFGLGDVNPTFYVSPPSRRDLILGFGPSLVMPTATSSALGAVKWSLGPAAAISYTPGKWLFGALVSNVWSLAGGLGRPAVNLLMLQPDLSYYLEEGWSVSTSPTILANWPAPSGQRWTVPLGGGVSKLVTTVPIPISLSLKSYYNAVSPSSKTPDWSVQLQINFLIPR